MHTTRSGFCFSLEFWGENMLTHAQGMGLPFVENKLGWEVNWMGIDNRGRTP